MDSNMLSAVAQLSDTELLAQVTHLAAREREATAALIAHLAELDARRLYLAEGCSSLFTYGTQVLHLSEHAAYGRIEAARAVRRFPIILERLAEGSVTLTTVGLLAAHLTPENHRELLDAARHQSKRQVELLVARLRPQPPVPSSIRKLPTANHTTAQPPAPAEVAAPPGAASPPQQSGDAHGVGVPPQSSPAPAPPPARPAVVAPLAPERYKVQFTASAETYEKLRLAQALLRHQIPDGDLGTIVDRALTALLRDVAKQKFAATDRPRGSRGPAPGSRHIPVEVKRAVWLRDGGRCAFVGRNGRRCAEQGFLEFHHVVPYAAGGESTANNIQLRCSAHNGYEAELYFGRRFPSGAREAHTPYSHPPEPPRRRSSLRITAATRSGPSADKEPGMVSRAWLFGLVLAVPLIGFTVAEAIQTHFNSELRSALRGRYPTADAAAISSMTVDRICKSPEVESSNLCRTNDTLNLMSTAALGAGAAGVALLLLIRLAGTVARGRRALLLHLFKPGLYLTALALIVLVLVHAAVAIGAIYYAESALVNRIHPGLIAAIGLGAFAGVLAIARSTFALVRKARTSVIGASLSQAEAPALWARVEQLAERVGALRPQNIVVGLDPNFFVTEADVVCLNGALTGRTLYCSLPLSRILSVGELSAVLGHELGHFKGLDTKFSERFYPIYRGTASSIASLQSAGGEGSASIALLPAIAILSYFLECFSVAESRISRDRELAADREGAGVTSAAVVAAALVKIHAFSGLWQALQNAAAEALQQGKAFTNASKTYAEAVAESARPGALEGLAETHLSHPTDSHPPLGVRLAALGVTLGDVSEPSLSVTPADAAIHLIPEAEKREQELSETYQAVLARQLGIDPNATAADGKAAGAERDSRVPGGPIPK